MKPAASFFMEIEHPFWSYAIDIFKNMKKIYYKHKKYDMGVTMYFSKKMPSSN